MILRDYQRQAVDRVKAALDRRPILVAPTGSGKTVMAVALVQELNLPTLWLAHRKELIDQASAHLRSLGLWCGRIMSGYATEPLAKVQVASVQTLIRRERPRAGLIVVDECVPPGTMIDTVPIEKVRVGDLVRCHDIAAGRDVLRRVSRVFRSRPCWMVKLILMDGTSLACTAGHPVFTQGGFVHAADLRATDEVWRSRSHVKDKPENVRGLRQGLSAEIMECDDDADVLQRMQSGAPGTEAQEGRNTLRGMRDCSGVQGQDPLHGPEGASLLLESMQSSAHAESIVQNDGNDESEMCLRTHEKAQPDAKSRRPGKDVSDAGAHRTPSRRSRRQWNGTDRSAEAIGRSTGLADGGRGFDGESEDERLPILLQGGCGERDAQDCGRSGRGQSLQPASAGSGSEAGRASAWTGVDRVEVLEPGRDGTFGGLCPDGYVYNLEVEEHHNYYAEGLLVHNCHHATASSYGRVLDNYPSAYVVGLTATPFRLDGRGLGDVFGDIVVAAYTDDLCKAGVLHDPKVYAGRSPDLRRVRIRMGDYVLGELSRRTNTDEQNADLVRTWREKSPGRRTVAFAVDVEHSRAIVEAFRTAGVAAEHIDGTTPKEEREAILGRLRDGKTDIVSNCMVLTEGWDLPALETAIIARPTASLNLHCQMLGRIMRACPGKDGATVLDHAGNHHVHGRVTRRIAYTLDSDTKVGERDPLRLRRCGACQLLYDPEASCCPECGWTPAPATPRERLAIHGDGQLVEFDDADFDYRAEFWRLIEGQRMAAGYMPGWSAYRFKERFGDWPVVAEGELVDVAHATFEQKRAVYQEFVRQAALKGFKAGWAAYRYKEAFNCWPKGFVEDVRRETMRARVMEAARA